VTRRLTGAVIAALLSLQALAADTITAEHIHQVIDATDMAAMNRDAAGIGTYLGENFEKVIEFPYDKWMAKVRLDKDKYLEMIHEGWTTVEEYDYQRTDMVIHMMQDGQSGRSYSTITETVSQGGETMISKFREYALYEIENGKPVITQISGHTLVGDTTPMP
jgi:hypothetical protein